MKFLTKEEYDAIQPKDKRVNDCPFCWDKNKSKTNEFLLRENDFRYIIYPSKPCGGVHRYEKHLLLIPKEHHINTPTLSKEEVISKQEADSRLEKYFEGEQYCSFLRHTDRIKSVQHIHYHYFRGNIRYRDIVNSLLYYDENPILNIDKES